MNRVAARLAALNALAEAASLGQEAHGAAALAFARACDWASPGEAADMRAALNAHTDCRALLADATLRRDTLEVAIAEAIGVLSALAEDARLPAPALEALNVLRAVLG